MKINFFTIFSFFISTLSFLLIYHRLDNSLSINKPSFLYFLIPLTFFILSIVSLLLSKKTLFFFSYTLIVIIFISYSVEGFLGFIIYPDINKEKKINFEKNNLDTRNKFEILDEIKKKKN